MGFRFRRRFGPFWLKINLTQKGFSSVSVGGKGLTANVPINRKGGIKYTAGIPGSGMSVEHQEKDTRGGSSRAKASASNSTALANAGTIAVVLVPIILIGSCVASMQEASREEARREAAQAEIKRRKAEQDLAVRKRLVVTNPRMGSTGPGGSGLATVKFDLTNNSNSRICRLGGSITYTTMSGARVTRSHGMVDSDPCLGVGRTNPIEVILPNRKLRGAMVGSTPKVTF